MTQSDLHEEFQALLQQVSDRITTILQLAESFDTFAGRKFDDIKGTGALLRSSAAGAGMVRDMLGDIGDSIREAAAKEKENSYQSDAIDEQE